MDKLDSDLVNLQDMQVDQTDVTNVHLRTTQEDTRMLKPEVVDRIRELSGQGLGSKRIARVLGVSRNSVRRYLAGATVGFQERPGKFQGDGSLFRGRRRTMVAGTGGKTHENDSRPLSPPRLTFSGLPERQGQKQYEYRNEPRMKHGFTRMGPAG